MHCPAPKHELFSSKPDLTGLASQVKIPMFKMKSPHLIDVYWKIKIKKKKEGGEVGTRGVRELQMVE